MNIWGALGFMLAGALITEFYHARMWCRYQQGKSEARQQNKEKK